MSKWFNFDAILLGGRSPSGNLVPLALAEDGTLPGAGGTSTSTSANPAQDGTDQTGIVSPAGATGIRGWLSASYGVLGSILTAVTGILRVSVQNASIAVTGTFFPSVQAVQGVAGGVPQSVAVAPIAYAAPKATAAVTTTSTTNASPLIAAGTYTNILHLRITLSTTGNVWLNLAGGAAVVGQGMFISSAGGSVTFGNSSLPMPTGIINAISDNGTANVLIQGG